MKYMLVLAMFLTGCAKETLTEATVTARDGINGVDGKSSICTVVPVEDGAQLSCSDGSSVIINNGLKGETGAVGATGAVGQPGTSCTVSDTASGAIITCGNSSAEINDGEDGQDGKDGEDGRDGRNCQNSSSVALTDYSGNSCTKINGTNSYVKKSGSNFALYSNSSCFSSSKFAEISQGEAYWAGSTVLVTHAGSVVRVLTFN